MQDRPTAIELLEAVRHHLRDELLPTIETPPLRFQTLVAANVLAVVARELALSGEQSQAEWERLAALLSYPGEMPASEKGRGEEIAALNRRLCQLIESGAFDEGVPWEQLLAHCRATAREKVAVSNPRFLQRLETEGE